MNCWPLFKCLPGELRTKLAEFGVLDKAVAGAGMPLAVAVVRTLKNGLEVVDVTGGHLLGYQIFLQAKERADRHIRQTITHCAKVINACEFVFLSDVDPEKVRHFLHGLREKGLSARTINGFSISMKGFCGWLVERGILSVNPLARLGGLNAAADRRLIRRALRQEEITVLIAATEAGGAHHGMTGKERSLIYRLAMETGLRWNEIYTLTRGDFTLTAHPSVRVRAENAKNGREAVLPLREGLAGDIAGYFSESPALPMVRAFTLWKKTKAQRYCWPT